MNRLIFIALILVFANSNCYSQIKFEKGYFIDVTAQKTDCLIKNMDWGINPTNFEYKLTEDSEIKQAHISQIKEFVIYNASKYIRALVEIDRSSNVTEKLSTERNPVFREELLFLKVLNFPINSSFDLTRTDGNLYRSRKILTSDNFAFGAGYKLKDKYMMEIRYETNRQILKTHASWETDFTTLSVIFGYTMF